MGASLIAAKAAWVGMMLVFAAGETHAQSAQARAAETVRALNADLLTHASATEVLGRWCALHRLADPPVIRALRDRAVDKPADEQVRARLDVGAGERVRYRRVRLVCGAHVLSNADNWYVPRRLTPDMNLELDQTDIPFGLVVKPLNYHRVRIAATLLLGRDGTPRSGNGVLRHEAVLVTASGEPFSFVAETYTPDVTIVSPPGR
jgi:chorismate-pyruvate lyase